MKILNERSNAIPLPNGKIGGWMRRESYLRIGYESVRLIGSAFSRKELAPCAWAYGLLRFHRAFPSIFLDKYVLLAF